MRRLAGYLCILFFALSVTLNAQSTFGSIVGTITDPSGATVSRAEVTVTNSDENTSRKVVSDAKGNYQALNLSGGHYQVRVSQANFEEEVLNDIRLDARQTARVDVSLKVGTTQQSITVEESAGVIESETSTVASTYGSDKILTLPANLRASTSTSPYLLITTLPGVQPDTSGSRAGGSTNVPYFSIQGGLPNQSEATVDGISAQDVRNNRPLTEAYPSTEAIAELKVQGVGNTAEYGSAGDISMITKSGGNTFHGSGGWYYQNADFDATPFGSTSKPAKEVNDYALSLSGPVWIPKLYHGTDKTFFFADFEQLMYPRESTIQNYVPTAAMKLGNFAAEGVTIYQPGTKTPFPNNAIPMNMINPVAQKIQSTFFPDPNTGNLNVSHTNNWNVNKASDINSKQFDLRGDQYISARQSVFVRWSWKNATQLGPNDLLQPTTDNTRQERSLVISHNYIFTPHVQNEIRLGWTSDAPGSDFAYNGKAFEQSLGLNGLPPTPYNGLPDISFSDLTGLGVGRAQSQEIYRTLTLNNNTTWTLGSHNLKFGFDIRWLRSKTALGFIGADNFGNFDFNGAFTGNQYADFLLGVPDQSSYGNVTQDNDGHSVRYQAYVQDSWRFSQKLTLEYGIRWDFNPGLTDSSGNIGNFDTRTPLTGKVVYPDGYGNLLAPGLLESVNACPNTPNFPSGGVGPGIPGVPCTPFVSNSQDGLPGGLRQEYRHNFYPRFGFAYRPFTNGNTVIRGGFGMYDAPLLGAVFYSLTGTAGTDVRQFNNIGTNGQPIFSWPNTRTDTSGVSGSAYGNAYFGTANSINLKNPYMMQWDLSIDRNIGHNTGLRVTYIGEHSVQLGFAQNWNQSPYSTTPYSEQPLTTRPFPYWYRIENRDSGATAKYESLQVELNRRFAHGLSFTGAYTLAKNLSDQSSNPTQFGGETGGGRIMDAYNRAGNYGNEYGTRRNRFVATAVYDLPFGRGRSYLNNANGLVDALLGGWHISTIFVAQTGPFETPIFDGGDPSGTGSGLYRDQRPDRIAGVSVTPTNQNANLWINPAAFVCPGQSVGANQFNCHIGIDPATQAAPIGRFGNSGVGIVQGPGTVNLSMGLGKTFNVWERLTAKIEASFTNLPNVTNFADPNLHINQASFGQVTSAINTDFGGARSGQVGVRLEF